MSKVFAIVGKISAVASTVALLAGNPLLAGALAANSAIMGTLAQVTAKPPVAQGQVNDRVVGANNPSPYLIGRSYSGGIVVHDTGYGGEVDDVKNPYRFLAIVYSVAGPVHALESVQLDFATTSFSGTAATGYYADYLWRDYQLGARPEADALAPHQAGATDWGSDYKLSGMAAIGFSFQWSKKGRRFAGGALPVIGAIWQGVKVYDPRLDSTYPGGSGSHRIDDETTWGHDGNVALNALAYAYGRYVNGVKIIGVDLGEASIDLANIVAWANLCDANGWQANGTIYEPGDKWNNLKKIAQAGGAQPVLAGGVLSFDFAAPRIALASIGRDDIADGSLEAGTGRPWKERHNGIVPKYRSEAHQWEYVQSARQSVAAFVTEDGEDKDDELQYDLVTDKDQAAQLGLYELYERRAAGPFSVPLKPHMRIYRPGDSLTLLDEIGLWPTDLKVRITNRSIDPATGIVTLTLVEENDDKHDAALAATGTAPGTITLPTSEDIDSASWFNGDPDGYGVMLAAQSYTSGCTITGTDAGSDASITISAHDRIYSSKSVDVDGATISGLAFGTTYSIYYDDAVRAGGAVSYQVTTTPGNAFPSSSHPNRHNVGAVTTPADGAADTTGYVTLPPGWNFYFPF